LKSMFVDGVASHLLALACCLGSEPVDMEFKHVEMS
jgi:hypothetical protein